MRTKVATFFWIFEIEGAEKAAAKVLIKDKTKSSFYWKSVKDKVTSLPLAREVQGKYGRHLAIFYRPEAQQFLLDHYWAIVAK